MTVGMLWLCMNKELLENIQAAAAYYEKKYGRKPELCLVHPSMFDGFVQHEGNRLEVEGILVRPYRPVPPQHIWIGIEEKPTEPKESEPV
jgi:hypothetical protein